MPERKALRTMWAVFSLVCLKAVFFLLKNNSLRILYSLLFFYNNYKGYTETWGWGHNQWPCWCWEPMPPPEPSYSVFWSFILTPSTTSTPQFHVFPILPLKKNTHQLQLLLSIYSWVWMGPSTGMWLTYQESYPWRKLLSCPQKPSACP